MKQVRIDSKWLRWSRIFHHKAPFRSTRRGGHDSFPALLPAICHPRHAGTVPTGVASGHQLREGLLPLAAQTS